MAELLAVDSSCLVALACTWHERHEAVAGCLANAVGRGAPLLVPPHALIETYAVLTRLPPPHQVAPADALAFLTANANRWRTGAALSGDDTWRLLRESAEARVAGGAAYDGLIATSARFSGATAILTLNPRHFRRFEAAGLTVIVP